MTPDQCRAAIHAEYMDLNRKASNGEINHSAIECIMVARAHEAARHNGIPECWRDYLPDEFRKDQ